MAKTVDPRRATPPLLKDLNERTVLETIRSAAPISRAQISRRAGISKPTVSLALQSLLEAGLVREATPESGRPSYGATFFEPVADAAFVLGLDLGARFLRGAVSDLSGELSARQDVEHKGADADEALRLIVELRDSLLAAAGVPQDRLDGVVVGVPGMVERSTGRVQLASNVSRLEGRDFGAELAERLGAEVTLENDINLAALGEQSRGIARGIDDFVFLSVGTGLGAGLVLGGELHRGHHGAAGELDYALGANHEAVDPCAEAISELARDAAAHARGSALNPPYDGRSIFAAARAGDAVALGVVDELARRIALHAAPIAAVADVELVVLGGGLGANGDLLLEPVRELLGKWTPYPPRVEVSTLGEAAVLTGALAVGISSARDNVFVNRVRAGG
jgi:predicted NBD/HSP70 family sugar kinase